MGNSFTKFINDIQAVIKDPDIMYHFFFAHAMVFLFFGTIFFFFLGQFLLAGYCIFGFTLSYAAALLNWHWRQLDREDRAKQRDESKRL